MVQFNVRVGIVRMHREAEDLRQEPTGDQEVFMQGLSHKVVPVPVLSLPFLVNTSPSPFHCLELGYNVHV